MEYFRIIQVTGYSNVIHPQLPTVSQIWGEEKPILVKGRAERTGEKAQFLSFYQATILSASFLISKEIGEIWKEFQLGGRYRPCVFGDIERKMFETYYFMYPRLLTALHKETTYQGDGNISEIILSETVVKVHKVFGVKGKSMTYLIVAGDVLDRMLQKGITGFEVAPIKVKEGFPWPKNT